MKVAEAQREEEEHWSQRLEKELEVKRHIIECNASITKLQETQLVVYKTQLVEFSVLKIQLYIDNHQQR